MEIDAPAYVALDIALHVCALPGYFTADVERRCCRCSARAGAASSTPDRFSFGDPVYLSAVVAAAMAVTGVSHVEPLRFQRLNSARGRDNGRPDHHGAAGDRAARTTTRMHPRTAGSLRGTRNGRPAMSDDHRAAATAAKASNRALPSTTTPACRRSPGAWTPSRAFTNACWLRLPLWRDPEAGAGAPRPGAPGHARAR